MPRIQDNREHAHQHNRLLRSFRSHKTIKPSASPRQQDMRLRLPSDASSMTRSSTDSSCPSTSRTDMSVEWDPLRLHPPLAGYALFSSSSTSDESMRRYHHQQQEHHQHHHQQHQEQNHHHQQHHLQTAQSPQTLHGQSDHHSHSRAKTVIYDGFDFGFDQTSAAARDVWLSPSSPTTNTSRWSYSEPATPPATPPNGATPGWGDAVTLRPHPAGMDTADYFIKRGGWKRRGIVFGADQLPMASESETFDLDMD
ncbi:hypothetical protein B0T17DRAFT_511440 [Bombardia bombarda]|uniref:Uncharacterized protein n=1 Tax=Bombardia bombarda TaxID=252184 RepID=A0AA39TIS3_9PEZI|nr:hypothetical protein B0T17DRAFT_511440 [Bombardia bombarda]